jgi:hypothetical protein
MVFLLLQQLLEEMLYFFLKCIPHFNTIHIIKLESQKKYRRAIINDKIILSNSLLRDIKWHLQKQWQ